MKFDTNFYLIYFAICLFIILHIVRWNLQINLKHIDQKYLIRLRLWNSPFVRVGSILLSRHASVGIYTWTSPVSFSSLLLYSHLQCKVGLEVVILLYVNNLKESSPRRNCSCKYPLLTSTVQKRKHKCLHKNGSLSLIQSKSYKY